MKTKDYQLIEIIFKNLCENHDLNYHYSDDSVRYNRGVKSFKELMDFSKKLLDNDKKKIYNSVVDKKIKEDFRQEYYLK